MFVTFPARFDLQRALQDLEDVRGLLDALKGEGSSVENYENAIGPDAGVRNILSSQKATFRPNYTQSRPNQRSGNSNNMLKRNYNLDHLARMNFRRSFRASKFNDRHILGGL